MAGILYLCATPIGNLGDMSPRAIETLKNVDLIAAEDTRQTVKLLNHFGIDTKMTSYYEHNKRNKGEYLIRLLREGKNIAVVSDAGTPGISDPGEDMVEKCIGEGITVTSIPGPAALISAVITSGLCTGRFCFEGFLSVNKKQRKEHLAQIKDEKRTMIFYEAPHKLIYTLRDMYETLGERKISIARELTKKFEEINLTTLSEAIEKYEQTPPKGEFVLVIEGNTSEPSEDFSDLSIEEHVKILTDEGYSESDAMKAVAKKRGMRKNEVYALIKKK